MAATAVLGSGVRALCPSFAEVCSFLERYGAALDLPEMSFTEMEGYLRDTTTVAKPLMELHVKLLRKMGKYVSTDRWEKYLAKICLELNHNWSWDLEHRGYQEMSMECKSSILKFLCESQFDDNLKFKMAVNEEDPEKMRLQPIGRDQQGLIYWLQLDQEQNIRLYTEEQDDTDGSTWKCIVRTRNDLAEALRLLKAQIESNVNQCLDWSKAVPAATSAPCSLPGSKAVKTEEKSDVIDENPASQELHPVKEVKSTHQVSGTVLKQQQQQVQQHEIVTVKEEKLDFRFPASDNCVNTITKLIQRESTEERVPRTPGSVFIAPDAPVTKQEMTKVNEAERTILRSSQQAKIPLKKRDLKLAECYPINHLNNSRIIVCNPSVTKGSPAGEVFNSNLNPLGQAPQELTNRRPAPLDLSNKERASGLVGHVGVIRSSFDCHIVPVSTQQDHKVPCLERQPIIVQEQEGHIRHQSVLVKNVAVEDHAEIGSATTAVPLAKQSSRCDQLPGTSERYNMLPSSFSLPQFRERPKEDPEERCCLNILGVELGKENQTEGNCELVQCDKISKSQEMKGGSEMFPLQKGTGDVERERRPSGKMKADLESSVSPLKVDQGNRKDLCDGITQGLMVQLKSEEANPESEVRYVPLLEASSELQKEGIRLKIKIPPHRRDKLRAKEGKEKERKTQVQEVCGPLRRSARISKPSSKAAESTRRKPEGVQVLTSQSGKHLEEEGEGDQEQEQDEEQGRPPDQHQKTEASSNKLQAKWSHRHRGWAARSERSKLSQEAQSKDNSETNGAEERRSEELLTSEDSCSNCGLPNYPELILLCDLCDSGYHTACLRPPLMLIPDGDWFCPPCQHKLLCDKLEEQLHHLDDALKRKERSERRRERLVYVGISVENIIPDEGGEAAEESSTEKKDAKRIRGLGRRSTRTRKKISYSFDAFDDAIEEAIEEDVTQLPGEKESERAAASRAPSARTRKRRRLRELESDSSGAESEDDFTLSDSSDDFGSSGDAAEEGEPPSDGGSSASRRRRKQVLRETKEQMVHRGRRHLQQQRGGSSEEDSEQEADQFSSGTDSDSKRRSLRRGHQQQVNYRETSDSSDGSSAPGCRSKGPGRPVEEERLSSDFSAASLSSGGSDEFDHLIDEERERMPKGKRRRGAERDQKATRKKLRKLHWDQEDHEEERRQTKSKVLRKRKNDGLWRRLKRAKKDEELLEKISRGHRRERRLVQVLKKRKPLTDEESSESDVSLEEERPIRRRLNRIDSDDDDNQDEGGQKSKDSPRSVRSLKDKSDSDSQETDRRYSFCPSNGHWTSGVPARPGSQSLCETGSGAAASWRRSLLSGTTEPGENTEGRSHSNILNSVQNIIPT